MSSRSPKPRAITVAGRRFRWTVRPKQQLYPGYVVVAIWDQELRSAGQRLEVRMRFDDPWLNYGPLITTPPERVHEVWALAPVTPAMVARWIAAALERGWTPDLRGSAMRLRWDAEALSADEPQSR